MEAHEICEKFIAADTFYDGKNANITLEEIKKKQGFEEYCRSQACDTRKKIIGALSAYLFMKTRGKEIYGQYDEFFLMWLSDKLFEIVKDEGKVQSKDITLNEAYDKYLKKNIKNGSYWSFLDSKKGLKEANLKYMRDFYKLLNHICSTILDYKNNGAKSTNLIRNSTNCSNQYILIYKNIYKCKSYLHLLDNLKKIYYNFRDSVISENKKNKKNLTIPLQTLTTPKGKDEYFANDFKTFDFNSSDCKPKKAKKPSSPKKEEQPPSQLHSKETGPPPPPQPSNLPKDNQGETPPAPKTPTSSQNNAELQKTKVEGSSHKNGSGASGDEQKGSQNSLRRPDGEQGDTGDTSGNKGNSNSENGSSEGGSGDGSSGSGSPGGGKDSGGGAPGSGANDGSSDGSKTSMDQAATHSSGASDGYLSNLWRTHLSPMNNIPTIPDIYETPKNILASTANKITSAYSNTVDNIKYAYDKTVDSVTNAYNSTMIVVKDTYNSTMTNITNAYTTSTNYISGAVSSITNQLSSLGSFSQLSDNQPKLGGSGNSLPTENNPSNTTQIPKPDPNSPSSMPQSPSQSITSPPLQTPSQPQSNLTQDPPQAPLQDPSSPKQHSSTHDSQDTVQNDASNIVQQSDPNTVTGVQTMAITQVTLPNSITDPSSTWNGSTIGTIVKMSEKSSIWCIGSNKKCDILGIGIIGISIFVFLAIMYKYISFGSAKNSKKKKSMKRVIKYGDGTRKTQIIIKSYDRNKHLKPIINSVGRKKDPLLNTYKHMQADPVPFINLFFLLIFFVYKKNYII
ncbi:PIR protein CIR protein [Plasmodium vinckei lentum]|uniref:PIR protein CIR protein n=1 Tax=Plasmodium vinckei lentum TaxID=138297 RepID=A0A6V7RV26_PLAVN|nr:PIR protein CIR protein [Plasmodium vinckei lentum]